MVKYLFVSLASSRSNDKMLTYVEELHSLENQLNIEQDFRAPCRRNGDLPVGSQKIATAPIKVHL